MNVGSHNEWMNVAEAYATGAAGHDGDGCLAVFFDKDVQDKAATEREGRAVFSVVPFVEIRIPGSPRSVQIEAVKEEHKQRWPKAWQRYLERRPGLVDGTPIEQWPYLNRAQVAELKASGVFTIEQLAGVHDGNLGKLGMGGRDLRDRARQHLAGSTDAEKELRTKLATQADEIENLKAQIAQLTKSMLPVAAVPAKRPGRPRKVA